MLSAWRNPGVHVYCVEPNPENGKFLTENIKKNALQDQITLLPYGIAAKKEKRELYLRESPHSSFDKRADDKNALSIQCMSVNDIFAEQKIDRCEVLKLDCEGAEYEALYALTADTAGKIQKIVMEYHDDLKNEKNTLKSLASHFKQFDFKLTHQHIAGLHGGGGEIGTAWLERVN
jgi:FkbM family methyltransferase